jgi:hypothetical protein
VVKHVLADQGIQRDLVKLGTNGAQFGNENEYKKQFISSKYDRICAFKLEFLHREIGSQHENLRVGQTKVKAHISLPTYS